MRIRLLKSYGFSRTGDVLEPDDPVAQLLIERGIAEKESERIGAVQRAAKGKPRRRRARRR